MNQHASNNGKSNVRMAIILGLVALGFFASGIYLATGGGAS